LSTANPSAEHPFRQEPSSESDHLAPGVFGRFWAKERESAPIYIPAGDLTLSWAKDSLDPETLRQMAHAFLRLADEKESS
jgi:hypothetical protein